MWQQYKYTALMVVIVCAYAFLAGFIRSGKSLGQESPPAVLTAVAPVFAGFSAGRETINKVVVEAIINADGEVISAKTIEASLFDDPTARFAAQRWRFAPTNKETPNREARLTFIFRMMPKETKPEEVLTIFTPPYQIEVRHKDIQPIIITDPEIAPPKNRKKNKDKPKP